MKQINSWPIDRGYTATFDTEDFESWWLAGRDRTDQVSDADIDELIDNCIYVAESERREMAQTLDELRDAAEQWAREWNGGINSSLRFTRYTYHDPSALPVDWDAPDTPDGDEWDAVVSAAGFSPEDEEIGIGRLTADWHGHRAGALVVSGATVTDGAFAVEVVNAR